MIANVLQSERDGAWQALGACPVRRYMLGRDRCDRLVRLATTALDASEFRGAFFDNAPGSESRRRVAKRVAAMYGEPCSSVFVSLVLSWAISAIVQYLIKRWWENRR